MVPSPQTHVSPGAGVPKWIPTAKVNSSVQHLIRTCKRRQRWWKIIDPPGPVSLPADTIPWRSRLTSVLESDNAHMITVLLITIDIAFLITELLSSPPFCRISNSSGFPSPSGKEPWYHWGGIAVSALLLTRSVLLVVGLGGSFFKRGGCVVDGAVVLAALVMEVSVEKMGGGLILMVSLWRLIRVTESAFELSDEDIEAQIGQILAQLEVIKETDDKVVMPEEQSV